jgi:SAM-dependent methyltransferase
MTNSITLVDLSEKMLEAAKKNTPPKFAGNVEYINADLHSFGSSDKFDVVLCIGVLAHVVSVEETVAKVSELLRPGGRCLFQVTDNDKIVGKLMNAYYSVHDTFQRHSRYSLNKLGLSQVVSLARRYQLTLLGKRQYLSPFLGMGRLPNEWLFKYELFTLTHDWISRLGSETISLYRKNSGDVWQ